MFASASRPGLRHGPAHAHSPAPSRPARQSPTGRRSGPEGRQSRISSVQTSSSPVIRGRFFDPSAAFTRASRRFPSRRRPPAEACPAARLAAPLPELRRGPMMRGYLKVRDACPVCSEELHHHRADDGPAYLTILIVGHLLAPAAAVRLFPGGPSPDHGHDLHGRLRGAVAVPSAAAEGGLVALQWAKRMHGFGDDDHMTDEPIRPAATVILWRAGAGGPAGPDGPARRGGGVHAVEIRLSRRRVDPEDHAAARPASVARLRPPLALMAPEARPRRDRWSPPPCASCTEETGLNMPPDGPAGAALRLSRHHAARPHPPLRRAVPSGRCRRRWTATPNDFATASGELRICTGSACRGPRAGPALHHRGGAGRGDEPADGRRPARRAVLRQLRCHPAIPPVGTVGGCPVLRLPCRPARSDAAPGPWP
jgi:uncharacterized protein (DUF983 family)